jgi:CheY-like chemotaxis protein
VDADPTRLSQVLDNLLGNANKFTDPGGRVTVRVACERDRTAVTVTDTGVGIAADMLGRVWDIFAQADTSLERTRGGLGLGLALVKGLVRLHGGAVHATSAGPGLGAAFTFDLPLADGPAPAGVPADGSVAGAGGLHVLVIEDHADAAESLRLLLELQGQRVTVAATGPAGLDAVRDTPPDVVLCDLGLPGLSGYEVARALRQDPATAGVYLVAVSGYGSPEDREKSQRAGFDEHLVKPVEPDALQRLLAGRRQVQ